MGIAQTEENPNQDVVTVAWSAVDVWQRAELESVLEIANLEEKVIKTQGEVASAQGAVVKAQTQLLERRSELEAALTVLSEVSAENPVLAAEALARR